LRYANGAKSAEYAGAGAYPSVSKKNALCAKASGLACCAALQRGACPGQSKRTTGRPAVGVGHALMPAGGQRALGLGVCSVAAP
jgi:hypothetical protein